MNRLQHEVMPESEWHIGQRVMRGAAYLDKEQPGWHAPENIDIDLLRMNSDCMCVWGNLSGAYRRLEEQNGSIVMYHLGFRGLKDKDTALDENGQTEYRALDRFWREEIIKRREADAFAKKSVAQLNKTESNSIDILKPQLEPAVIA